MSSTDLIMPIAGISRLRPTTDGDGIRTLICTYGCPLACKYCINPQTWSPTFRPRKFTMDKLYEAVCVDNLYFQATGGGLTFGGGEPALYSAFIRSFSQEYCSKWSVNIETSLNYSRDHLDDIFPVIDHYIIDIKDMNSEIYRNYTGQDNHRVRQNLEYLLGQVDASQITVRIPRIPGYNSSKDQDLSEEWVRSLGVANIDRFTYRRRRV